MELISTYIYDGWGKKMTVLAVFRSRAQTIDYVSKLKARGVTVQTVNTPQEAGVGCGISAKFDGRFLSRAKLVFQTGNYSSFAGFFVLQTKYGRTGYFPL